MPFANKLDLLMDLTKTSNSQLARSVSLDASFISRLRHGVRIPVKHSGYITAMARYFARSLNSDYQKAALLEAVKSSSQMKPHESESMEDFLCEWLLEPPMSRSDSIDDFLEEIGHFQFKKPDPAKGEDAGDSVPGSLSDVEIFFGTAGKREAVLKFLSLVMHNDTPQTLLLYSNEDLSWLSDAPDYLTRWAALMFQVLKNGNRIKMIHTINRNIDEMLTGIKGWVPIYMTGSIEPYYYPKTRDGIFRRTLFIAPETAAVTSSSVRNNIENTANLLFTRKDAVQALKEEYDDFISLCRPLMRIFNPFNQGNYLETLAEFEAEKGDTITKSNTLTNITMPVQLTARLIERLQDPSLKYLISYNKEKSIRFNTLLQEHRFTEIFPLPDLDSIFNGKAVINFSDMPVRMPLFYTPEEYKLHLENIIRLLKTCKNYHVYFANDDHLGESVVCVKEDVGVLVAKASSPSVIFAINESNLTAAFWDYMNVLLLKDSPDKDSPGKLDRQQTIAHLEAIAAQL